MTDSSMSLWTFVEKTPDAGLVREMIGLGAERLMELQVDRLRATVRGAHHVRHSATAVVTQTGKPAPEPSSYVSRSSGIGPFFPSFLEPRRMAKKVWTAVIHRRSAGTPIRSASLWA